jgi:hypothetical protein
MGIIGALYERGAAARVSEKSHAGDDRGIPPFKKRRVGHPADQLSNAQANWDKHWFCARCSHQWLP